ncbi:hypothetical protein [Chitinophaga sp.]|uniref:hypothetical protein n=1 Tax=Chitinophaga sp. TaxID=1869181 RepID=UPI0026063634|nr:hypothetical protein [uncultured Chitinophaga sp.]
MKTLGIILIIAGIVMMLVRGFFVQTDKEILDAGPVEITKKENRWIGWPTYVGAVVTVAGIVMVMSGRRRGA